MYMAAVVSSLCKQQSLVVLVEPPIWHLAYHVHVWTGILAELIEVGLCISLPSVFMLLSLSCSISASQIADALLPVDPSCGCTVQEGLATST